MKKIKHTLRLYKMNRLWGDNMLEALYYALRNKAFVAQFADLIQNDQELQSVDIEDEWWRAIK